MVYEKEKKETPLNKTKKWMGNFKSSKLNGEDSETTRDYHPTI